MGEGEIRDVRERVVESVYGMGKRRGGGVIRDVRAEGVGGEGSVCMVGEGGRGECIWYVGKARSYLLTDVVFVVVLVVNFAHHLVGVDRG